MGNWRTAYPVENGSFPDDPVDWMETPEGQQSIEVLHVVFDALDHVDVDAKRRMIVWPDGKRLSIAKSAERLHAEHPDMRARILHRRTDGGIRPAHAAQPWLDAYERKRWGPGK